MKKSILLVLVVLFTITATYAQQGINYKAVISDNGNILKNQAVQVQFSIIHNNSSSVVYQETHSTTTDDNGIIILNIGEGTAVSGLFYQVYWEDTHSLKVEIDTGSGFKDFGTSTFQYVPYAKYASNGDWPKLLGQLSNVNSDVLSLYLGENSGSSETDSNLGNTAVGHFSLESITTGLDNTAFGTYSLWSNNTGRFNVALGSSSGFKNLGTGNIFLGYRAGYNETGSDKLYIENSDSDTPLIGGDFSTDIVTINGTLAVVDGTEALGKVLTSDANGLASWQEITQEPTTLNTIEDVIYNVTNSNLFIGKAGNTTATGSSNYAIGYGALTKLTIGQYNNAFGYASLNSNTEGTGNSSFGQYSNFSNTTGDQNTSLGYAAHYNNTTGNFNTAIGTNSGFNNTTGNNNVFLGYNAGYNETGSDKLYIENSNSNTPLIGGDFNTDEVTINGKLNVTNTIIGNIEGNITATHSGTADMKAYLFGSVGLDGVTFDTSSSDGFTSSKIGVGDYKISSTDLNVYTVTATMRYGFIGFITVEKFGNEFRVKTYNTSGVPEDRGFDFIVFKR